MPQAPLSRRKWLALSSLFVVIPALCGCLPEQQQQVLKCEFEFLQTDPDGALNGAAAPSYVAACMGRHGYIQQSLERGCELEDELNAHCYAPRWRRSLVRLLFDRGPNLPGAP